MRITAYAPPVRLPSIAVTSADVRAICDVNPSAGRWAAEVVDFAERYAAPYRCDSVSRYPGAPAADYAARHNMCWFAGDAEPGESGDTARRDGFWYPAVIAISAAMSRGMLDTSPRGVMWQYGFGRWLQQLLDDRADVVAGANAAAAEAEQRTGKRQLRMVLGGAPKVVGSDDVKAAAMIRHCIHVYHAAHDQGRYLAWWRSLSDPANRLSRRRCTRILSLRPLQYWWRYGYLPCSASLSARSPLVAMLHYWLALRPDGTIRAPHGCWFTSVDTISDLAGTWGTARRVFREIRAAGYIVAIDGEHVTITPPASGVELVGDRRVIYPSVYRRVVLLGGSTTAATLACCLLHALAGRRGITDCVSLFAAGCHIWGDGYLSHGGSRRRTLQRAADWLVSAGFAEVTTGFDSHGRPRYRCLLDYFLPPVVPAGVDYWREPLASGDADDADDTDTDDTDVVDTADAECDDPPTAACCRPHIELRAPLRPRPRRNTRGLRPPAPTPPTDTTDTIDADVCDGLDMLMGDTAPYAGRTM